MVKIYPHLAGNTLGSHEEILEKLKKKGATIVKQPEKCDVTIVFCPIASRFETDIRSALSNMPECRKVILVAMHHTFDRNYMLPRNRQLDHPAVILLVDCLFFEKEGLLPCQCNKEAKKMICKKLHLGGGIPVCLPIRKKSKRKSIKFQWVAIWWDWNRTKILRCLLLDWWELSWSIKVWLNQSLTSFSLYSCFNICTCIWLFICLFEFSC